MKRASIYDYKGKTYPSYLKDGNAMRFIEPLAKQFCVGDGLDIGCGRWPLPDAIGVDQIHGDDVMNLKFRDVDYVFSSHCLEHLPNPVAAIKHWREVLKPGGVLFLYLPHPDMEYWRPVNCEKHLHTFYPADIAQTLRTIGFFDVLHSERDLAWSFAVVGRKSHIPSDGLRV